jgi:hypothetical protein
VTERCTDAVGQRRGRGHVGSCKCARDFLILARCGLRAARWNQKYRTRDENDRLPYSDVGYRGAERCTMYSQLDYYIITNAIVM